MLNNFWYAVAHSEEIAAKPLEIQLLGRRYAAYRGADGKAVVLGNRCPHRGASLSAGFVKGCALVCPYHGWEFEADGACSRVPANPEGVRVAQRARVESLETTEGSGFVWAFVGELPPGERPPIPVCPEFGDPSWRRITGEFRWKAHYTRVVENAVDIAHAPFVHSKTFGNPNKPRVDDYEVEQSDWAVRASVTLEAPDPKGIWKYVRLGERKGVKTTTTIFLPNITRLDLDLGKFHLVIFSSNIPVDGETTLTKWSMYRDFFKGGWADGDSRRRTEQIFLEDQPIVESERPYRVPDAAGDELHVKADAIQLALRRMRKGLLDKGWGLEPADDA